MNCKTLLIILAFIYIILLSNNNEKFAITSLTGPNNMVLTDNQGNLSSINFPKGIIVMWKGNENNVPQGWAICDGTNDTPDLRGRFVLGLNSKISPPNGLVQTISGNIGGSETHTLTVEEMPSHTHDIIGKGDDGGYCKSGQCSFWPTDRWTNDEVVRASTSGGKLVVENTGNSKPHNNMPPFYVLAYIMKL